LQFTDNFDNIFELGTFPAQGLGAFRIIPDIRLFQFPGYFD